MPNRQIIDELFVAFYRHGHRRYGEAVTQMDHMLQSATFAEQAGSKPSRHRRQAGSKPDRQRKNVMREYPMFRMHRRKYRIIERINSADAGRGFPPKKLRVVFRWELQ